LALHNYESTFGLLPPGYLHKFNGDVANHMGFSWGAMVLPQLEETALYDQFDFHVPVWAPENLMPREQHLATFLCPSDPYSESAFVIRDDSVTPIERYAAASYAANWGPSTATVNLDDTPLQSRGVFYRNS